MSLDQELSDQFSLIQQFQASLMLGPLWLFVDGVSELDPNHSIAFDIWFPTKFDSESKFVFTVRRTSDLYLNLTGIGSGSSVANTDASSKSAQQHVSVCEMRTFLDDADNHAFVARFFSFYEDEIKGFNPNVNCLVAKYLDLYTNIKESNHVQNPMYITLMAHEVFIFDKEIHKNHRVRILDAYV